MLTVFYRRFWVWNIMLWKYFCSFIDLTGTTKTSFLKGNTNIPRLTDSTFSIREYNSKNLILGVSEVQYIKISMLKCYFMNLCYKAVWYNSSSFIFNIFNFNPESTKFTTINSTNEASHIFLSQHSTLLQLWHTLRFQYMTILLNFTCKIAFRRWTMQA